MAKLPWFKFYAHDWLGSSRVRRLSGDQIAAYVWLLCEQWDNGHLPFDVTMVTPGMPKGISESAVAFVLTQFFPPDPDTNLRRNPKLAEQQAKLERAYEAQVAGAAHAREVRLRKLRDAKRLPSSASSVASRGRSQKSEVEKTEDVVRLPEPIALSGKPFFTDPKTRLARVGEVQMLLGGARGSKVSEEAVARALSDMATAGTPFTPVILKRFAERAVRLLDGEAGQRAARTTLEGSSPVSRQPDANQSHSGFSEDELE